jgi:serine protease DegQ
MLRKLWLLFAQAVTVYLAVLFVVSTLRPDWLALRPGARGSHAARTATGQPGAGAARRDAPILSYSDAANAATSSVVNIYTTKELAMPSNHPPLDEETLRRFFGGKAPDRQPATSLGSGVIVSADGLILTNNHVIEAAEEIEVLLADGRRGRPKVIGSDPETDLAVLKVDLPAVPAIAFGDDGAARVGDVVLAIGNPFGVGQTVTMGIVSALGRNHVGINTFENFIQTDAAINPGNSGGALVDSSGRLLGINAAIYSRSGGSLGIGFAIPASTAHQVMDQIVANGSVTRGFIGVEPQDITRELAEAMNLPRREGALIAGLVSGGPAEKAGVKVRDVLIAVAGTPVANTAAVLDRVSKLEPGKEARFLFLRDGREIELPIVVGKRPRPAPRPK